MSLPVIDLAAQALLAGPFPLEFNKREKKMAEAAKAYADSLVAVKPAFVVVAAANKATVAGATQTIAVAGVLSTDLVFAVLKAVGATPRTILTASAGTGSISVVMSGDPSTDHTIAYQVLRANA